MVFSSHVTLGKYSLTIELYWAKHIVCKSELENGIEHSVSCSPFSLFMGLNVCVCWL